MSREIWRNVPGMDFVFVSNSGRVFIASHQVESTRIRNGKVQTYKATMSSRFIPYYLTKSGYPEVAIQRNGVRKKYRVHRLVGLAFIDGYSKDMTINHMDGNKQNNTVDNLEWVSLADNTKHQWKTGLVNLRGENNPSAKLTYQKVKIIRKLLALGVSAHSIATLANVCDEIICGIRDGRRWTEF